MEALNRLGFLEGISKTMIVRSVIYSRECMRLIQMELKPATCSLLTESFSDLVGTMCTIQELEFNRDILPLVERVDNDVKKGLQ